MKKLTTVTSAILISGLLFAGGPKFNQKMGQTISLFARCETASDFQNLANQFKIIGNVEKKEWLPLYYEAHCYIIMSFMESGGASKKDAYLDIAETALDKMVELAPDESEVFALEAFYYTARLVVNPQERGQKFGGLSMQAVNKSIAMDTANPRAKLIKLQNEMGTARFFGNDITPYYARAEQLLNNWDNYKPKSAIYPNWGKGQVQGIVDAKQ